MDKLLNKLMAKERRETQKNESVAMDSKKQAIANRFIPGLTNTLRKQLDSFVIHNDNALIHPSLLPLKEGVTVNGGIIEGGILIGGTFNGGWIKGGTFHGGTFTGGVFNNGTFHGGNFTGGNFNGGTFYGGTYNFGYFKGGVFEGDVVVHDGVFMDGSFKGGTYYGGTFCQGSGLECLGGTFNGGRFVTGTYRGGYFSCPLVIIGSAGHSVNVSNYDTGEISIGCLTHTVDRWLASIDEIGQEHGYTPEQIKEYTRYIHVMLIDIFERNNKPRPDNE